VNPPPLSLYIHLPWCVKKCPYCDFNSHRAGDAPPRQRYIQALLKDLNDEVPRANGRVIESIFLGGGTPSLFSPDEIDDLLKGVSARFELASDAEVTMEANPGTVECGSPAGYRDAGVTRLSIGAQSFDDKRLAALGRIHSSADIVRAVDEAKMGGFTNFNIDLMHALPDQTVEMALDDLNAAIRLGPSHISWYQLTLEPNTIFHARPPANMPDDDLAFEIQDKGQALLREQGYEQYEISAYARNNARCRHNLNYWLFGDYLAVGAGAHGKITTADGIFRYQKPANPLQYMMSQEAEKTETALVAVGPADQMFEFMLNALRLHEGFAEELFLERTNLSAKDLMDATVQVREKGLMERSLDGFWKPSVLGARFLNDLQSEFIVERD
jgi:putative oxygen-independent coproporphyrinogen III oxidase